MKIFEIFQENGKYSWMRIMLTILFALSCVALFKMILVCEYDIPVILTLFGASLTGKVGQKAFEKSKQ